jgi:hypothetical protein
MGDDENPRISVYGCAHATLAIVKGFPDVDKAEV